MLNLSENEKKVLFFWGIIGAIIVCFLVLFVYEKVEKEKEVAETIIGTYNKEIIDRDRYYTAASAINKFYSYANAKDAKSVLQILDENYVEKNNINNKNISDFINFGEKQLNYKPGIMCLKKYNKGNITLVTDGIEQGLLTGEQFEKKYYEITMNGKSLTFSLKPIEKKVYTEVCNG